MKIIHFTVVITLFFAINAAGQPVTTPLFEYQSDASPRWSSPENKNGEKGHGATENNGAKGHSNDPIDAGASKTLLDVAGTGMIDRIWITINDRSPVMLRSLRLDMFWDNESKPAVSVPLGDFFGVGLGRTAKFSNALFSDAEGRSFVSYICMPFKKGARIVLTNESGKRLGNIFFDVDYQVLKHWQENYLYFHAYWSRDTATTLGKDFELLPGITGKGRFLGVNVGVDANPLYKSSWWGEGEVKMYLDGDREFPTLAGTGTEDYIGTAWGQGLFFNSYAGCLVADPPNRQWAFYRFHIPDPVFFTTNCRVTLQQIGGDYTAGVKALQREKAPLLPITIYSAGKTINLYKKDSLVNLDSPGMPSDGWTNFYRSDDISAVAYFYLDSPTNALPALQPLAVRTTRLNAAEQ
jgi:Protein of unknown function (DUF2961)